MANSNRAFYKAYDAMEKPFDLGQEVLRAADIEVGKSYYFRSFSLPYTKARVTGLHPGYNNNLMVDIVFENGSRQGIGIYPGNPNWLSKAYFVNPKPLQKAIGEIFVKKTNISTGFGTGPANVVRSFLNVQPTKKNMTKKRKERRRKTRRSARK